jgi:cyclophilin family peptidyl-prolyl cis-trans isomerase
MRKLLALALFGLSAGAVFAAGPAPANQEFLSKVYTIDKKYRSMEGPWSVDRVYLGDQKNPELLWITGVRTEMVGEDGKTPQLPEFMCHVNVDIDPAQHQALFGLKHTNSMRLITLSQGMIDARVPHGFGFPIASTEPLIVFTQVLNHNIEHPNNMKVRHRVTFEYVRDCDLTTPMKPLFNVGVSGMVPLEGNTVALQSMAGMSMPAATASTDATPSADHDHGPSCSLPVSTRAPNSVATSDYVDPSGKKFTGHWVVPPGKQVTRSDITWFMALPFDTTLHYAAMHLHPFARSIGIRDVTTGQTVVEAKATGLQKGVGLARVDTYSSEKGIRLYKDHKYEIEAVYNNTTKENTDSMASVYMGLEDPEFVRPDAATLATRAIDLLDSGQNAVAVVRTSVGDFGVVLLRGQSPDAVKQFLRLARSGAYEHARIAAVRSGAITLQTAPLNDLQKVLVHGAALETAARHDPGTLSLCPGDAAFVIVLGNVANWDGKCTAFGRIGPGGPVLRAIAGTKTNEAGEPVTPIEISRVEIRDATDNTITLAAVKTQ